MSVTRAGPLNEPIRSAKAPAVEVEIRSGYQPGVIGRCVEMHALYYARTAGFGAYFERVVAAGLAEFVGRLDNTSNGLWTAVEAGIVVGTLIIDGKDLGPGKAHLRWFIVDDGRRGGGVGRRLLAEALAFCDRIGFAGTELSTFKGLDAARKLYEANGFSLVEEQPGSHWGKEVLEQRFIRRRPP